MFSLENLYGTLIMWPIFLVAAISLHKLVLGPTLEIIEKRKSMTSGKKDEIDDLSTSNEDLAAQYQEAILSARKTGSEHRESLIKEAREVEKRTIEKVRAENDESLTALRDKIAEARAAAKTELEGKSQEIAQLISQKMMS